MLLPRRPKSGERFTVQDYVNRVTAARPSQQSWEQTTAEIVRSRFLEPIAEQLGLLASRTALRERENIHLVRPATGLRGFLHGVSLQVGNWRQRVVAGENLYGWEVPGAVRPEAPQAIASGRCILLLHDSRFAYWGPDLALTPSNLSGSGVFLAEERLESLADVTTVDHAAVWDALRDML